MAGKIKNMIDTIIKERAKGSEAVKNTTRVKLILKGIKIDNYTETSDDDPAIIASLQQIAAEMGLKL